MNGLRQILPPLVMACLLLSAFSPAVSATNDPATIIAEASSDPADFSVESYFGDSGARGLGWSPRGAMPTHGDDFAFMGTGNIGAFHFPALLGTPNGGYSQHYNVDNAFDMMRISIAFTPAVGKDCLSFDFHFATMETIGRKGMTTPETQDAFIATLDPNYSFSIDEFNDAGNFAVDQHGEAISEYTTGALGVQPFDPATWGSTGSSSRWVGATDLLRAQTPVAPGVEQTLHLIVIDQFDGYYDSAVLFDNLTLAPAGPGGCAAGTSVPGANMPPTAVASASHTLANLGEGVTFDGSGSSDAEDLTVSSYEWRHDGAIVSTSESFTTSFSDLATQCVELTVYDSEGLTGTDDVCLDLTDELDVVVLAGQRNYRPYGQPEVKVFVNYLSGTPIHNADVVLNVEYQSHTNAVNTVLDLTPCRDWRGVAPTNVDGMAHFTVPRFFLERCWQVLPGIAEIPTEIPLLAGKYKAHGNVVHEGNQGIDADSYSIGAE